MGTATLWYATREGVKNAVGIPGPDLDSLIDSYIKAASQDVENLVGRRFIPETATKYFPWPTKASSGGYILYLEDEDLIAVTTLKAKAQDTTPTTIVAADFFLEPVNAGPPYTRIEIDLSSSSAFEAGDTSQRSISILGRWGYCEDTEAAGALAEMDDGAETDLDVTDSSLIGVGDTILIEDEALFVSGKTLMNTSIVTTAVLTASKAGTTVGVSDGTALKAGETITIDSERMFIESISGDNLTVQRSYDGSVLATHVSPSMIYAPRTLTVVRAVNGTTAAVHGAGTAIVKYAPPADVVEYCRAKAIALHQQGRSGWTGVIGGAEGAVETRMFGLWSMGQELKRKYGKVNV